VIESQLKDLRWTGVHTKATAQDLPSIDTYSGSSQGMESNPSLSAPIASSGGVVLVPDHQRMTGQHAAPAPQATPSGGYPQASTQQSFTAGPQAAPHPGLVPNEAGPVTSPSTRIPVAMPPGPISIVPTNAGTALPMPPQAQQPSRSMVVPILVAATAMIAVVAVGIRFIVHAPQPSSGAQPALTASAATSAASAAPPASDAVKLIIRAKPAEARIYLDEVMISTGPFEGKVLRSDKYRLVRVEAEGYQPKEEEVVIGSDLVLSFDLQKADKPIPAKGIPGGKRQTPAQTSPGGGKPLHDIDSDSPYGNKK
jgi:serine/threonine-protein kinase